MPVLFIYGTFYCAHKAIFFLLMHHVEAYIIFSCDDVILQNVMYILTHHQKKVKFSFAPLTRFASLHAFVFLNQICAC